MREYFAVVWSQVSEGKQLVKAILGQLAVELAYRRVQKRRDEDIHPLEGKDNRRPFLQKWSDLIVQALAIAGGYAQRAADDVKHLHSNWFSHGFTLSHLRHVVRVDFTLQDIDSLIGRVDSNRYGSSGEVCRHPLKGFLVAVQLVKPEARGDLNLPFIEAGKFLKKLKTQPAGMRATLRGVIWLKCPFKSREGTNTGIIEVTTDGLTDSDTDIGDSEVETMLLREELATDEDTKF